MFFHLRVFLHSIAFFILMRIVLLESVSGFLVGLVFNNIFVLAVIAFMFMAAVSFSALSIGKRWSMVPIPVLLAMFSVGLVAFIDSSFQKFVFISIATLIYYACLLGIYRINSYFKDQTARSIIASCALAAIFIFYSTVYGVYLNFTVPLWMIMLMFFLASSMASFQYFKLVEKETKKCLTYAMVIGLAMTEIAWMLSFWPFGYLTTGVVMLIFYYVLWDMVSTYFAEGLSKKRAVTNMLFFGCLIAMVLVSSKWLPVV